MLSKGNARIPYSLGEFGALVFCPISVFTLLLCCFLSLLSVLSSSLSFEDISEGAFRGSKTVNMPLKHAKRLLCTYNWRLLSDKQVTSVHGIPPPSLLRALLGCVALSQQIRLSHLKRWAIWWSRVPNPPGVEAKGFCRCPEVRRTFPRQVGASLKSVTVKDKRSKIKPTSCSSVDAHASITVLSLSSLQEFLLSARLLKSLKCHRLSKRNHEPPWQNPVMWAY